MYLSKILISYVEFLHKTDLQYLEVIHANTQVHILGVQSSLLSVLYVYTAGITLSSCK
jgi:hypothetical protein